MTHDLVIRSGTVVDGTGRMPHTADVAIDGSTITTVGRVVGQGRREVSADGALVTPGFVDIHTHYDGQATWDDQLTPSSWHGVTTAVMGNCGVGFAPVKPSHYQRLIELIEGVEDIPEAVLHEGLTWDWSSFPEYLDVLDRRPRDIDVGAQVPHAALRVHVMGERGAAREAADDADITRMAALMRESLDAGALGFTTSRTLNHRTSRGEPTPTLDADRAELLGISDALRIMGKGVLQAISDFDDVDEEFALFRAMAEHARQPISISIVQDPRRPDLWRTRMDWMQELNASGITMRAQVASRAIGVLLSFDTLVNPFVLAPEWKDIAALTPTRRRQAVRRLEVRRALIEHRAADPTQSMLSGRLIDRFDLMFVLGDPPDYEPPMSSSIAAVAERERRDPAEVAYDALLAGTESDSFLYMPIGNYVDGGLESVGEQIRHPVSVAGLSDGGAHVGTICDVSFPTTLLQHWGRDRATGRLPIELLVHKQTQATARTVELFDRGVIAPGYKADLNVIDFDGLRLHPPELHYDLPAGGRRLLQRADGYLHTFVGGTEIRSGGTSTEARPGRLIRGRQPAP